MSDVLPPIDELLAEFDSGKVPRSEVWHTLITGLYSNFDSVNEIENWYNTVLELTAVNQQLATDIKLQHDQIEIWYGQIDTWQQQVSQNTTLTEQYKDDAKASATAASHSENAAEIAAGRLAAISNPNLLINGDFSVWQRGEEHTFDTSSNIAPYTSDRWQMWSTYSMGTCVIDTWTPNSGEIKNVSHGIQINLSNIIPTANQYLYLTQCIEDGWSKISGKNVSFSFLFYVPGLTTKGNISVDLIASNGLGALVPKINVDNQITGSDVVKVTGSWKVPEINTETLFTNAYFRIFFEGTCRGNIYMTHAKLEVGSVATPFIPDDPATNLAKCQRYYQKIIGWHGNAVANSYSTISFLTEMRTQPTAKIDSSVTDQNDGDISGGSVTCRRYVNNTNRNPPWGHFIFDAEL